MVKIVAHDGFPRWSGSGADLLEVDVRRSAKGELILSHDPPRAGAVIAKLDDALLTGLALQFDLKEPGFEIELVHHVLKRLAPERIAVTTGMAGSIKTIKERFPHVEAGLTLGENLTTETWRRIASCHADFVAVDQRYAESYRSQPLRVWLWTVDDERRLKRYTEEGWPEAIITNRPDVALRIRKGRS